MQLVQGRKVTSTDAERSPTRNTVAKTQVHQDLRKKLTPYRDDDQDSGFGGNYTGSVDEGGLVFDWSCYGDHMDITFDSFLPHVARPSTSRTKLGNPSSRINSSRNGSFKSVPEGTVSSEVNLFPGSKLSHTECYGPNHLSPVESDLMPGFSNDLGFSDNSNYRGKEPTNKRYTKRNIRSPSPPCATLLQISLNKDEKKVEETKGKVSSPNQCPNIHSVPDIMESIQENTNPFQCSAQLVLDNTSCIEDRTNKNQINASTRQDNTNTILHDTSTVQNTNSAQKNMINIRDNTVDITEDPYTAQENTNSFEHEVSNQ